MGGLFRMLQLMRPGVRTDRRSFGDGYRARFWNASLGLFLRMTWRAVPSNRVTCYLKKKQVQSGAKKDRIVSARAFYPRPSKTTGRVELSAFLTENLTTSQIWA